MSTVETYPHRSIRVYSIYPPLACDTCGMEFQNIEGARHHMRTAGAIVNPSPWVAALEGDEPESLSSGSAEES